MQNNYKLKAGSIDALQPTVDSGTTSIVPALCFMKEIPLTQGRVALVDDQDYEVLVKYKWCICGTGSYMYAMKSNDGKLMHRIILGLSDPNIFTDHIDHNGLNNQRDNLRVATRSQNTANKKKINGYSKYLGVGWDKTNNRWEARVYKNGKKIYLGVFKTEIEAAICYNNGAKKVHGEFASLNIIPGK